MCERIAHGRAISSSCCLAPASPEGQVIAYNIYIYTVCNKNIRQFNVDRYHLEKCQIVVKHPIYIYTITESTTRHTWRVE